MIPTPDISHLTARDYDLVYEPAEDTFLLLDALEHDFDDLKALSPATCLEIGSGTGCVSSFIGQILGSSTLYLCTDINSHACNCTRLTGDKNKTPLNPIHTSFAQPFYTRLRRSIDVIVFNPPYVPTNTEEALQAQNASGLAGAWAGGSAGMQVTNRFLDVVGDLLSPRGRFYLVTVGQNNVAEIRSRMLSLHDLHSEIVLSRLAGRERLSIVRFTRSTRN